MTKSNAEEFILLLFDGETGFTGLEASAKGQPELYQLFNVCRMIPEEERTREDVKERSKSLKPGSWEEVLYRNKSNQRTRPIAQHIYCIMKVKEREQKRISFFRWRPTSLLEAKLTFWFLLTIKWTILKLYSDTGSIKLVWLGLGWVITSHSRTLHTLAEPSREDRGRELESRCKIPMA